MKTNQLTKSSTNAEIKTYFNKILQLSQLEDQFPVNLDEVWMLVYSAKDKAVRALKKEFIEDVDYQSFTQNGERGAASPIIYKISVSCLEYFIARKIRPVFEVYRQVFHATIKGEIPTLPKRKATGKRVETYLPNEDVLRLQIAAYQAGYPSVYSLLQRMIYEFLENPYRNYQEEIRRLHTDLDYYKNDALMWRNYLGDALQIANAALNKSKGLALR